jgi:hypothetical protein
VLNKNQQVAILYLLPSLYIAGIWVVLCFVSLPENETPLSTFAYFLSGENPDRSFMMLMLLIAIICLSLSIGYFSGWINSKVKSSVAIIIGLGLMVTAIMYFQAAIWLLLIPPLLLSFWQWKHAA